MKKDHRYKVDYRYKVTVPIRDMELGGGVAFLVDVYGVEPKDLCVTPGGGAPMFRAVERIGLDPYRYQASIFDIPVGGEQPARSPQYPWPNRSVIR